MSLIEITESAKKHIIDALIKHNKDLIHFSVTGGGCNGFTYHYDPFIEENYVPNEHDTIIKLDEKYYFVIDNYSLMYVGGCKIDLEEGFEGNKLVVINPLARSQCGCGKSVSF